jgi:hypothetical protein
MMRLSNDYWNEAKSQRGLTEKSDMTTSNDYWGQDRLLTQAEKRKEVVRDTFMHRAAADAELLNSGRFAKEVATNIVGAKPLPSYPAQPASSPWGGDNPIPVGGELDQVGYDLNAVEPVVETASAVVGSYDADTESAEVSSSPPPADSTPNSKSWRRF